MTRNSFIIIFLLVLILIQYQEPEKYPYKNGIPTSRGIDYYIKVNEYNFVEEYSRFVQDTIEDVYIETDNLSLYTDADSLELGRYYLPNGITITNETKFIAYDIDELGKYRKKTIESNRFVKAVVMHEITHYYFYRIIMEMRYNKMHVAPEYLMTLRIFPYNEPGSEFIEEGVCEYMIQKMGEINLYKTIYVPKTISEISDPSKKYEIKYKYASSYLKDFLDQAMDTGRVKEAIKVLLKNTPPSPQEILNSEIYFNRL